MDTKNKDTNFVVTTGVFMLMMPLQFLNKKQIQIQMLRQQASD